jgi:hypothetical protein
LHRDKTVSIKNDVRRASLRSNVVKSAVWSIVLVPNMVVDIHDLGENVFPKLFDQWTANSVQILGKQLTVQARSHLYILMAIPSQNTTAPFHYCVGYIK